MGMFNKHEIQAMINDNKQGWDATHFMNDDGLSALIDFLKTNANKRVEIRIEDSFGTGYEALKLQPLVCDFDEQYITICGNKLLKSDIWDIRCGNWYGGYFNIYTYDCVYGILLKESKMIDGHDTNLPFELNNYFNELLQYHAIE